MNALFVSLDRYLEPTGGGVQLCTREYRETLEAAGFRLDDRPYAIDRRWVARLRRRLRPRPFADRIPPAFTRALAAEAKGRDWVFLNQVDALPLAPTLRAAAPGARLVLLSHGAQFIDEWLALHPAATEPPAPGDITAGPVDRTVRAERRLRRFLDHVETLSDREEAIERALGARSAGWLPRTVSAPPLPWRPVAGRLGFVGTLDHAPNRAGLVAVLERLHQTADGLEVRVVGGPVAAGRQLAARFPAVTYLGPLDDAALASEAALWSVFLHPLFCWSRGCSTKLATAIGWGLPVLATTPGCRGYRWREGAVPCADDPTAFAAAARRFADPAHSAAVRRGVLRAAASAPTLAEVAERLREHLRPLSTPCASS